MDNTQTTETAANTSSPTAAANPVTTNTQSAAEQPKTFTQRFNDLEKTTFQMQYILQFHGQVMQDLVKQLTALKEIVNAMREVTGASMRLAKQEIFATEDAVAKEISQTQAATYKKMIENDVANNRIKAIDAIADAKNLVVFSSPEVLYGFQLLEAFSDEKMRNDLMGKKTGDKVGNLTLLGVYEQVPQTSDSDAQQSSNGAENGQAPVASPEQQPQ